MIAACFDNTLSTYFDSRYVTEHTFKSLEKHDELLRGIKRCSAKTLKGKIDHAHGFTSYWNRLETRIDSQGFLGEGVKLAAMKSAILAIILRTLQDAPDVTKWLTPEINAAKSNKDDHLLSRAVKWGLPETVELLLASGADPQSQSNEIDSDCGNNEAEMLVKAHILMKGLHESGLPDTTTHDSRDWHYMLAYLDPHDGTWHLFPDCPLRRYDVPFTKTEGIPEARLTWIQVSRNNVGGHHLFSPDNQADLHRFY